MEGGSIRGVGIGEGRLERGGVKGLFFVYAYEKKIYIQCHQHLYY
jgi:hypothetical protein